MGLRVWKTLRKSEEEIFEAKHQFLQLFRALIHTYEVKSTIWHTLILLIASSACSKRTSSFERNEQNNNKNDLHSTSSAEINKETQPKPAAEHEGPIPNIDEKNASKQEAASLSEADEEAERLGRLKLYFPIDVLATILTGRAPEYSKANKESPEEEKKRKERMEAWGREVKAKNLGPEYNKDLVIPGY